ncbi:putative methyltransferase DDB_G0268948 [Nematolebias whitei]|uniref:putative methyltransferase DDB_G0268948 n=1 Tax=Nematolebias whitei TaxID=451745 RepID=UPI001896EC35|nr:putative methyltransferase DDB_G0268948 [Nematolebias whitei]
MTHRLYEGKAHAATYWKYRISPSDHLMQQVLDFLQKQGGEFELAVDVGCGSGQGTLLLAKHFASVVGTDVSPAQLELALQHAHKPNITYSRQCVAEELPFTDSSVDLVTAMSAFHWFDRPRFLQEVHRVLKPRGCLALLNYTLNMELSSSDGCSDALNHICREFYAALRPFRSPLLGQSSIEMYREAFELIPYPEKEWHGCVLNTQLMPLSSYMGLVESFSCYQALLKQDPQRAHKLSQDICQRLMSVMKVSSAETEVMVDVKYFYLLACKPEEA